MKKLLKNLINNTDKQSAYNQINASPFLKSVFQNSKKDIKNFINRISCLIQKDHLKDYFTVENILSTDLQYLKGVGPKRSLIFKSKNIITIEDILKFLPNGYRDFTNVKTVKDIEINETVVLKLKFKNYREIKFRRRFLEAVFYDETSSIILKWFNYRIDYLKKYFVQEKEFFIFGKVSNFNFQKEIIHPIIEEPDNLENLEISPVYPLINKLSNKVIIDIIKNAFDKIKNIPYEYIPYHILVKRNLPPITDTYTNIHFPNKKSLPNLDFFFKRLVYDEFFFTMLAIFKEKSKKNKITVEPIKYKGSIIKPFMESLPFKLTDSQRKVLHEILNDLKKGKVLNRLIQGDVGSGKTLVAIISALLVIENKGQVAFMVPTEILAEQHYKTILNYNLDINVALLTGSTTKKNKEDIYNKLSSGEIDLVIGTHALIQENVNFKNIKLNIIDEQHKFGVKQRLYLKEKGSLTHTLIMTATPIPRTITLTLYGDLDVSVIDKLPPGRKPIKTFWYHEKHRGKIVEEIKKELNNGRQAYFIYPLVDDSEKLDLKSVLKMSEILKDKYFKGFSLGILHGKMKSTEKEAVMKKFADKELDILVSTTVIEVGIDVPNATVMVIEHAERFGLSQLHQLRGRIGRGNFQSFCYLVSSNRLSADSKERLKVMVSTNDGFKIAEADLKIRGPGEISGTKQSGIPEFQFADLVRDFKILLQAKEDAEEIINFDNSLGKFPCLSDKYKKFIGSKSKIINTG